MCEISLCLQISLWISLCIINITLYLSLTINTNNSYVLLDGLHGYMFRLIRGYLQAIKYMKLKLHL